MRYLGLLENVRVRRAGFAYRAEYSHFVSRFKLLCNSTWPLASGDDHNDTYAILGAMGVRQDEFEFGRTKLFIRHAPRPEEHPLLAASASPVLHSRLPTRVGSRRH